MKYELDEYEISYYEQERLDGRLYNALCTLNENASGYEPVCNLRDVGVPTLGKLIKLGLAEDGRPSDAYIGRGYEVGYQPTLLGVCVYKRGKFPKPFKRSDHVRD